MLEEIQMPKGLKLYDKKTAEAFPINQVGKHIDDGELNCKINEFIESGEHSLGVELVRILHWKMSLAEERARIISETAKQNEYANISEDFSVLYKIARASVKTDLLNKLYFIYDNQGTIGYQELKNLLDVI